MNPESRRPLLIAPLVLRLTLAAIFLYRGYLKVTGTTDWGASWLQHAAQRKEQMPKDLQKKFDSLAIGGRKDVLDLKKGIMDFYDKQGQEMPKDLQKQFDSLAAEKQEVLNIKNRLMAVYKKQGQQMPEDLQKMFDTLSGGKKQEVLNIKSRIMDFYAQRGHQVGSDFTLAAAGQLAVAWGELAGGLALLLGVLTRLAALGLIIIQMGAIYFLVTFQRGSFVPETGVGYEYNIALIAMCIALVVSGAGLYSFDHWWWVHRRRQASAPPPAAPPPTTMPTTG
jgi:uncharacterized membrane protein YphA (DoxX/SURF4 family)